MTTSDSSPGADREAARDLALMLVLTFATGVVDAGGFLGLDTVFLGGNMTGNVLILGMGAAGADGLPVFSVALASSRSSSAPGWRACSYGRIGVGGVRG